MREMTYRVDSLTVLRALQTALVIHLIDLGWNRDLAGMGYAGISVSAILGWLFIPNVIAFVFYWRFHPSWQMGAILYGLLLSTTMVVIAFALVWTGFTFLMMVLEMFHAGLLIRILYIVGSQAEST